MSVKIVQEEIERFLKNSEPEVLCLRGKWGVGKTYAWKYYLHGAAKRGEVGLKKYAYVSLFGLRSLEDVKYALFEGTREIKDLNRDVNIDSLDAGLKWIRKNYRKGASFMSKVPIVEQYLGVSEKNLFFLIRNQIVCIDDLERAGGDLKSKDVLGIISYLKEERNCKVILLLNDEKFSEDDKKAYDEQIEKVVDTRLDFEPTTKEAADIVFGVPEEEVQKLLYKNSVALGIINIRIIKKIERIVLRFAEIFGTDNIVMPQVIHSSALFCWSIYQPQEAPPIEFLKDFSKIHGLVIDKSQISPEERAWQELLGSYNYSSTDEFDLTILETILNGNFDIDKLNAAAAKQIRNISEANKRESFSKAWNLYHDSFDNNERYVLEKIYTTARDGVGFIEPRELDSTLSFLKEFGQKKEAKDLLEHYVSVRSSEQDLFDLDRSFYSRDIKDPDLIAAFKKKRETFQYQRKPDKILVDIAVNQSWNERDVEQLSKLTPDDFFKLFKKAKKIELRQMIRSALDFGKIEGVSAEAKKITENAETALRRISKESQMNERRVTALGIKNE